MTPYDDSRIGLMWAFWLILLGSFSKSLIGDDDGRPRWPSLGPDTGFGLFPAFLPDLETACAQFIRMISPAKTSCERHWDYEPNPNVTILAISCSASGCFHPKL